MICCITTVSSTAVACLGLLLQDDVTSLSLPAAFSFPGIFIPITSYNEIDAIYG